MSMTLAAISKNCNFPILYKIYIGVFFVKHFKQFNVFFGRNKVGRFWSLLFLSVPILGVAAFVFAVIPGGIFANHWLPEDISQHGAVIDKLFMFIMYLTGVVFIVTSFLLFWFMWKYDADNNTEPVKYLHGSHTLEIIWSIIPAATLLFIAIFQMDAWADARMEYPTDKATGGKKRIQSDPSTAMTPSFMPSSTTSSSL